MHEPSDKAREIIWQAEQDLEQAFRRTDAIEMTNTQRVLNAFWTERVAARHFAPTNGYGYDDVGRDTLDKVFARALEAEEALVRPQFVNGTHALYTMLSGICEPKDEILSITGKPYDTLEEAIGIRGDAPNSLTKFGIGFSSIAMTDDGKLDLAALKAALEARPIKAVYAQRSRGYAWREAMRVKELEAAFRLVHTVSPETVCCVDNCYGEFTEAMEPTAHEADLVAGSLIKNPGGGLAPTGGYIAGKAALVARIAQRLTVPGMGKEVGSYAASYRPFYQGLFMAPHTTAQCVKCAMLFARVFERMGLATLPESGAARGDIIQAVRFETAEEMIAFCQSIQAAAPIDSFATPEPWDMPGYADKVIMAAGTFVQGATTELSADGPIRPPYTVYLQGALTYAHARIAAMLACDALLSHGTEIEAAGETTI